MLRGIVTFVFLVSAAWQSSGNYVSAEWKKSKQKDEFGDLTEDELVYAYFPTTLNTDRGIKQGQTCLTYNGRWGVLIMLNDGSRVNFKTDSSLQWKDSGNTYEARLSGNSLMPWSPQNIYPGGCYNFTTFLLERDSLKCLIRGYDKVLGSCRCTFSIQTAGFEGLAEDQHYGEQQIVIKKYKERKDKVIGAYRAEKQREQILQERAKAMEKRKEPMLFQTDDKNFSVQGLCLGFTDKEVRLKRVDNGKEVTVQRSILSAETNRLIESRRIPAYPRKLK